MLDNLHISEDNRALCKVHGKDLVFARRINSFFQTEMPLTTCSECTGVSPSLGGQASFDCTVSHNICSISFTDLPEHPPAEIAEANTPLDFRNSKIEHMIIKKDSNGYLPGSLVYIPERRLLVVCESAGHICFWSVGEQVKMVKSMFVRDKIVFAKYYNISETKRYFIICSNQRFEIYNTVGGEITYVNSIIDLDPSIIDIECLIEEEKLLSVGSGSVIGVYDLKTMKLAEVLDMSNHGVETRIHRIINMKESKKLALEHERGLSIFDYRLSNVNNFIQHYIVENKTAFGCLYLPQNKRFILKNSPSESVLIDENGLTKIETFQGGTIFKASTHDNMRLISNQNESQVIGNHSGHNFSYFSNSTEAYAYYLSLLKEGGDVEVLANQWKFAAADRKQGIVLIFRANAIKDLVGNHYEPGLISIKSVPSLKFNLQQPSQNTEIKKKNKKKIETLTDENQNLEENDSENESPGIKVPKKYKNREEYLKMKNMKKSSSSVKTKTKVKAEKLGKKIKKTQVKPKKSKAEVKEKAKKTKTTAKPKKPKVLSSSESDKKTKKSQKEIVKMVPMKKEGRKEEKVWVVLDEEKKQRVRKNSKQDKKDPKEPKRGRKKASVSEERSRSRSGSKSLTRKAK